MFRISSFLASLLILALGHQSTAFTSPFGVTTRTSSSSSLSMVDEDMDRASPRFVERGVSVDQDGKSNVWAIEPKMEVSSKSSEESMQSALFAGGGLAVIGMLAGVALLNLPDPNQF